ncbi:hypothetical protein MKW98_031028 [Papaver atlanticum]|uniref:C2H2-type domain-containing protein n=1 Tax=Papaver atlanticum TaxID=357466 RepID=A0AAD4XAF5_9MAGN|nr:hypothetical protein MKW98_031028 [Papaver atlanticum]
MEKRNCKICFKRFSNGRALGGHMKSHMAILQTPPKVEQTKFNFQQEQIRNEAASSEEEEGDEEEMKNGLYYGLREHPKKSFRLVDPIFSSSTATMEVGNSSSVIIDRESETDESFKNNTPSLTRRRSKRNRRIPITQKDQYLTYNEEIHCNIKKMKKLKKAMMKAEAFEPVESEPVSSVSDNTIEEDVAFSLMMLSRDTWIKESDEVSEKSIEIEDNYDSEEEIIKLTSYTSRTAATPTRKKYQCESCKKVFRSYQALGGHRANHSKINGCILPSSTIQADQSNADDYLKCPVCFKSFKSRQALGGHKRIHFSADLAAAAANSNTTTSTTPVSAASNSIKFRDNLIDLNLPAPIEEDDNSEFIDLI